MEQDFVTASPLSGRLLPGERIIWEGKAGQGIIFTSRDIFLVPFSLLWCGFAIFWLASATKAGAPEFFTLWGSMFVCIGLFFVFGRFILDAIIRRKTSYALTDRRVLIQKEGLFGRFTSVALDVLPEASLAERGDGSGSIRFGPAALALGNRGFAGWSPALDPTPQFLAIADARQVFDMIQRQREKSQH